MGKQVTELGTLPSFTDTSLLPVHNGAGLKKGSLSQLADYIGTKFSNSNLLINSDFKINQRGKSEYTSNGYTVDRWKSWNVTVTPNANGGITVKNDSTSFGNIIQFLENATEDESTLSCYVTSLSGTVAMKADGGSQTTLKQGLNVLHTSKSTKSFTIHLSEKSSVTLKWVKLEQGTVATSFIAPNPTEELMKCQRFYEVVNVNCKPIASVSEIYIFIPCVKKRVNPSVTMEGSKNVWLGNKEHGLTFKRSELDNSNIKVVFSTDTSEWGVGFMKNMLIMLDAEIY